MITLKGKVTKVMPNGIALITVPTDYGMDNIIEVDDDRLEAGMAVMITIEPIKVRAVGIGKLMPSMSY